MSKITLNKNNQIKFGDKTIIVSKITHYSIENWLTTAIVKIFLKGGGQAMVQYDPTAKKDGYDSYRQMTNDMQEFLSVKKVLENLK